MPFGAAILAENLNTPNMKWGVFTSAFASLVSTGLLQFNDLYFS